MGTDERMIMKPSLYLETTILTIVPTLQRGNAARDAPASRVDGESIWPEATMSSRNRTSPIF